MGPRNRVLALIAVLTFPLSACAAIPETSDPKVVKPVEQGNGTTPVPRPPEGVDAFALVRSFIDSAAAPESEHAAARLHLTEDARKTWQPSRGMLIVNEVDTIPAPQPQGAPPNVQHVVVKADKVGRLLPDQSFVPETGEYVTRIRVERRADGQWRITDPPRELVVGRGSFDVNYRSVPIYFLDHERKSVVPDVRYVVSQPESTLPRRVVDLLMSGPSAGMRSAMGTALPDGVYPKTNTSEADDGALVVNLSELGDLPDESRGLLAAQVVLSLQSVSNARVRLQEEGVPLLPDEQELRPTDVASYKEDVATRTDLPGLVVVDERLVTLNSQAKQVPGPTGSGEWDVLRAARSRDGERLAAVVRRPEGGVQLRVGSYGERLPAVPVVGADMARPTWRGRSEAWTVVDGREVVRVFEGENGWVPQHVDAREFAGGQPIKGLRLSKDGTRVAGVVDGHIVVAGVSHEGDNVVLREPTVLKRGSHDLEISEVEWLDGDSLVAITTSNTSPVVEVSVDGYEWSSYTSTNLIQPVQGLTVAPDGRVVVSDESGVWAADGAQDLWGWMEAPIYGPSIPFFPG
ncbi:LpqB family beta-propeller domain-containing protein [Parasphingorhabdus pacifica]